MKVTDDMTGPSVRPVGALLRRPAIAVRHEVLTSLHDEGFADVQPAHLGVFLSPGPDGQRPSVLARRAHTSKQAMNHLLHQLESTGYLTRTERPAAEASDQRTHVVRLTERGRAAEAVIRQATSRLDREWRQELGQETYADLAEALEQLHAVIEARTSHRHLNET